MAHSQIPGFKQLWSEMWSFYKDRLVYFILLTLFFLVAIIVPMMVVFGGFAVLSFGVVDPDVGQAVRVLFGLLGIVAVFYTIYATTAYGVAMIHASFSDTKKQVMQTIKYAFEPKLVLGYLLGSIVVGVLFLLGFVALIIPAIYLMIPFAYWPYIFVKERPPVFQSVSDSFKLAKGYWWVSLVRLGWLGVIVYAIAVPLQLIPQILSLYVFESLGAIVFVTALFGILSFLVAVFVLNLFSLVFTRVMYQHVRAAKKGNAAAAHKMDTKEKLHVLWIILALLAITLVSAIPALSMEDGNQPPESFDQMMINSLMESNTSAEEMMEFNDFMDEIELMAQ